MNAYVFPNTIKYKKITTWLQCKEYSMLEGWTGIGLLYHWLPKQNDGQVNETINCIVA